jgi:hypothetical protein
MLAAPTADTLENLTASAQPIVSSLESSQTEIKTEGAPGSVSEPGSSILSSPSDSEFLREEEVVATSEGMPSGELDEEPPKAEAASASE